MHTHRWAKKLMVPRSGTKVDYGVSNSRAPITPIWDQQFHGEKKLSAGSKLGKLPLLTTFGAYGVAGPKLGPGRPLYQVLRFFWRGV